MNKELSKKLIGFKDLKGNPLIQERSEETLAEYRLKGELKEADFPLKGTWPTVESRELGWDEDYFTPTLSELIEACEERFFGLFKCDAHSSGGYCWKAEGTESMSMGPTILIQGNTPEEAVANLWLALHKKD